jgi:hypothetical protein
MAIILKALGYLKVIIFWFKEFYQTIGVRGIHRSVLRVVPLEMQHPSIFRSSMEVHHLQQPI